MSLWSVLPIWSLLLFFSTFYHSDSSLQGEAGKHQLSVLAFLTSSVQWRQHKAATWRGRTDPEAALVLYKRQLGIRDASAPYHQSMPMGNIKSQLLLKFLAWSAHLIAKLNPQARACISKLSRHVLMQIKHVFSLGHCQRESRNNPETLWPQSLGNLPVTYLWGWKNQTRKGSKPVSLDWRNPTDKAPQVQQVQEDSCRCPGNCTKLSALMTLQASSQYFLALFFWTCILKFHFH